MANQARGSEARFIAYEETTYGAAPSPANGIEIYLVSENLNASQPKVQDETLGAGRTRAEGVLDKKDVRGDLNGVVNPQWFGLLMKHAFGGVTTTGAGPYTHTFGIGNLPVGLTIERDYGATLSGSGRVIRYHGCRVNELMIDIQSGGFVSFTTSMVGANFSKAASILDSTPTTSAHRGFGGFETTLKINGAAVAVAKNARLMLSNDLDEDGFVIGGGSSRGTLPEGFASAKMSGQFLLTDTAFLNYSLDQTELSVEIVMTRGNGLGSAGNESLSILMPNGKFPVQTPGISGPKGVVIDLEFEAYRSGTTEPMTAVLTNSVSTVWGVGDSGGGSAPVTGTKPRMGVGAAVLQSNAAGVQALFEALTEISSASAGAKIAGSSGSPLSLSPSGTNYGWFACLASAAPSGVTFNTSLGAEGWDGAGLAGQYGGAPVIPSTAALTYTDGSGNNWKIFRQSLYGVPVSFWTT
jgi:hypothetical protein